MSESEVAEPEPKTIEKQIERAGRVPLEIRTCACGCGNVFRVPCTSEAKYATKPCAKRMGEEEPEPEQRKQMRALSPGHLVIREKLVTRVRELLAEKKSNVEIASIMQAEGLKSVTGKEISVSTVNNMSALVKRLENKEAGALPATRTRTVVSRARVRDATPEVESQLWRHIALSDELDDAKRGAMLRTLAED